MLNDGPKGPDGAIQTEKEDPCLRKNSGRQDTDEGGGDPEGRNACSFFGPQPLSGTNPPCGLLRATSPPRQGHLPVTCNVSHGFCTRTSTVINLLQYFLSPFISLTTPCFHLSFFFFSFFQTRIFQIKCQCCNLRLALCLLKRCAKIESLMSPCVWMEGTKLH